MAMLPGGATRKQVVFEDTDMDIADGDVTILSPVSGESLYIQSILVTANPTNATIVRLKDGTTGTVIAAAHFAASTVGGFVFPLPEEGVMLTADADLVAETTANDLDVVINVVGYSWSQAENPRSNRGIPIGL